MPTSARVESSLCGRERRLERHPQLFIFRLLRHTVTRGRRASVCLAALLQFFGLQNIPYRAVGDSVAGGRRVDVFWPSRFVLFRAERMQIFGNAIISVSCGPSVLVFRFTPRSLLRDNPEGKKKGLRSLFLSSLPLTTFHAGI